MIKIFFILALFFAQSAFSKEMKHAVSIILENELNEKRESIRVGVHEDATPNIDKDFGEYELIKAAPPETLFGACEFFTEDTKELVWSYYDARPLYTDSVVFTHEFKFVVSRGLGSKLYLKWSKPDEFIESAYITDVVSRKILVINMKDSTSAEINNEFINDFYVRITYHFGSASADNQNENIEEIELYPNPAVDMINIKARGKMISNIRIFNMLGTEVKNMNTIGESASLPIDGLSAGGYYMTIVYNDGSSSNRVFVKN